jgi:hypothetical protein
MPVRIERGAKIARVIARSAEASTTDVSPVSVATAPPGSP